jgi:23S rRNA U2552 (ribose-2'-O)-methylase RlmE/FtsJ
MKKEISYRKDEIKLDFSVVDNIETDEIREINELRNNLDNIDVEDWKKVRYFINNYDFDVNKPIINRAFFKYWEIVKEFDIFEKYKEDDFILHCCEAPGGFIQATNKLINYNKQDKQKVIDQDGFELVKKNIKQKPKIWTISLNKSLLQYKNYNLPSYNRLALNSNVKVIYGKDNTGNLNNWNNVNYLEEYIKERFYIITADGGFDERSDFNHKELLHYRLILSEIYTAIKLQKEQGTFILKMFDIYTVTNYHLLYLLSQCYSQVFIYKPLTSRPTNSEKYIICKGFLLNETERSSVIKQLYTFYYSMFKKESTFKLFKEIPADFIELVDNVNKVFLKNQVKYLKRSIELCNDKEFLQNYKSDNIHQKYFLEWCKKYEYLN